MFVYCDDTFSVLSETRCGHTNMYYYFQYKQYTETGFTTHNWRNHHNSIVVLRNPLDRVVSGLSEGLPYWQWDSDLIEKLNDEFVSHTAPYMNTTLVGINFRIIDFYRLEEYIPRMWNKHQSRRTNSRVKEHTKPEDVFVRNDAYTLRDLEQEFDLYKDFMANRERVSVDEWKDLTRKNKI